MRQLPQKRSASPSSISSSVIAAISTVSPVISAAVVRSSSSSLLLFLVTASCGCADDHVVVGGSPGISTNGEVDAELLEEVSDSEVDVSDLHSNAESSADSVLHPECLGNDDLTSGDDLGEGIEFGHDLTTESNGTGEIKTESLTLSEIIAT